MKIRLFVVMLLCFTARLMAQQTDLDAAAGEPLSSSMILIRPLITGEAPTPPATIGIAEQEQPTTTPYQAPPSVSPPVSTPPTPSITPITATPQSNVALRTVRTFVGQLVEITFEGNGWVYLGEAESRKGISYDSRRVETDGQRMVFRAESIGTYTLQFYKQDFIQDRIINEQVRIIVNEASERSAASWTSSQDLNLSSINAVEKAETTPPSAETPPASTEVSPILPTLAASALPDSGDYLQKAREAYTAGKFNDALTALDTFRQRYPLGNDEAWLLYGQTLEAPSNVRDIRSSLDYYRRLLREYPQSPLCADARKRIAYIERYFFMIP
ncbi:MAG: outer membrane protein assembly factor BamD [Treponema sp.]|nr:outer membrane protein assembly factor BamD [Treponema sp.]